MAYSTVLFDLDHTLLDSDASEAAAFELTLRAAGCADPGEHVATYRRINGALWAGVERGEVSPNEVKTLRFEQLIAEVGLDADPNVMGSNFVDGLANNGELYDGARELLDVLAAREDITLALVTNGIGIVQRTRLERLDLARYFEAVAISGELGVSKPGAEIFDLIFAELGEPERTEAVMIGDSLSSDIAGGTAAGIDTVWYNPKQVSAPDPTLFTHEIHSLGGLVSLL